MSRNYIWDEIFHATVGFDGASLGLAMISGWIRRLKCCAEAVWVLGRVPDEKSSNSRLPELLRVTMDYVAEIEVPSDLSHDFVALLDELDTASNGLIKDCKYVLLTQLRRSLTADISWVEVFWKARGKTHDSLLS